VPLLTRPARRPTGRTKVATPSSVPSSGFLPLSTDQAALAATDTSPCELAVTPWRPDASRPCYMPLASLWSCPTELSLPEEPFLLSQAVASLRVRIRLPPARRERVFHDRFPRRVDSLPRPARRRTETHESRRRFPAIAEAGSGITLSCGLEPALLIHTGLAGKQPARPLRSFAPPGSPFACDPMPWPGRSRRVGALLGISPLERAPSTIPGPVSHVDTRCRGSCPDRVYHREPSHLASIARPELRRLGSRTQDLPARCGRSNPRATVRQPSSLENRSRRFSTPIASLTPGGMRRLACAPSRRRPAPPPPFTTATPERVSIAGPRRR